MERRLEALMKRFALTVTFSKDYPDPALRGQTKTLTVLQEGGAKDVDRYEVARAPGLTPLRLAFEDPRTLNEINLIEGRVLKKNALKPDEFWRLFFDETEPHGLAKAGIVGVVKQWPPDLEQASRPDEVDPVKHPILLWAKTAQSPMLFWKTADNPAHVPTNLQEIRDAAIHAWKLDKARIEAENYAKKILADLTKQGNVGAVTALQILNDEAGTLGESLIRIDNLSPIMVTMANREGERQYGPYELPRGRFEYPPEDMAKRLLEFTRTPRPKDFKRVVVIPNNPRKIFYVVADLDDEGPKENRRDFDQAFLNAGAALPRHDFLLEVCQEELGKQYYKEVMQRLREDARLSISVSDAEVKKFDEDTGS
jgi:hypothetical protein